MTNFLGPPRLTKGAIVAMDAQKKRVISTISFQYNPETVTRSLQVQSVGGEGNARSEALRLKGPPVETLKLDVELDATDQLEKAEKIAVKIGIYPQLAALETLIYPTTDRVKENMRLAGQGTIEILPLESLLTLLYWGKTRILPVRLTEFSITEEAYDVNLNPIRAKISLGLRVLSYEDLPWDHLGSQTFFAHHRVKEQLARVGNAINLAAVTGIRIN
ncbi:hypothetical protein G7B40_009195 [Aetokthonos hydrillicola Thurmond2011]|jgi:hypothetical protein|uniref:Contractile injection system tube protein N-terminal domain-containing protein n=1 Tax=Aetokthonos hydrillicola Thurmond2011 TaxID=2712845 RepID=A0AAP5I462_9CYAN|nr:hypothetical protein [Aetokthonos hydrillicola]MBO3457575.1 hypothetical protein [Aetokthonos hydrillicola CCALA 1050]MBW4590908.1 hypothetical protein [Aetokthonos hydrillicola CCALA 1050]MDR9894743.1 hypothetical protein [Aetokthonos hydrillicola Thurmond2011]